MYKLYVANKNYSSWSLRPWVLMRVLQIPFIEQQLIFGHAAQWQAFRAIAPSGKVPCLVDGDTVVWDSLAIIEYLAEKHQGVWPNHSAARVWARCAAAEMHSGFGDLRSCCSMSCGVRVRLHEILPGLERDLARVAELWTEGLRRFGGPFLAGQAFTAVDAFFTPVAFRLQTYGLALPADPAAYSTRLLALHAMREWYRAALEEKSRDPLHEAELLEHGTVTADIRLSPH